MAQADQLSQGFYQQLAQFPPALKKLALFIAKSDKFTSISQYAKQLGLKPDSVYQQIRNVRKKGRDFNRLMQEVYQDKLGYYRPVAFDNLIRGVQKGSPKHLEIYFTLLGDLKKEPKNEANTTINNLCFVLPMPESIPDKTAIPENNGADDHSVINVEMLGDPEE